MELAIFIWLAQVIPALWSTMLLCLILGMTTLLVSIFIGTDALYLIEDITKYWKRVKLIAVLTVFFAITCIILPRTEKQFYWIAGAYVAQQAVTSDFGKKLVAVIENKALSYLDDLAKDEKK